MKAKAFLTVAATLLITSGAQAATADVGFHVLNTSQEWNPITFVTQDPTGCPNIAFPTPLAPPTGSNITTNPTTANRIQITNSPTNEVCSTRYTDQDGNQPGTGCLVDLVINNSGQTVVTASGNCKMDPAGVNVILNSGS